MIKSKALKHGDKVAIVSLSSGMNKLLFLETGEDYYFGSTAPADFSKRGAPHVSLKTVSDSKQPIHTMGGLTIVPDCLINDMVVCETSVLLLPGADTWNDPKHGAIIKKASYFLSRCYGVCNLWCYCCTCQLGDIR